MEFQELDTLRSVPALEDYDKELRDRMIALDREHEGLPMPDGARDELVKCKEQHTEVERRIAELKARAKLVEELSPRDEHTERGDEEPAVFRGGEARGDKRTESIYDFSRMRFDIFDPTRMRTELRDRALRAIEAEHFPLAQTAKDRRVYGVTNEETQANVASLLEKDTPDGYLARRILITGHPAYRRAYAKIMSGRPIAFLTQEEQRAVERAFTLGTTGLPLPYTLDATVVLVSNGVLNPWRQICSVESVVTNEWRGVTAAAVTAAYAAEGTETSDNTPTMAQPVIAAHRAQVFIPFSIEVGQDWNALQANMARLIADAKDVLESNKFFSGSGTDEPFGLNAATTAIDITTAVAATFAIGDLYALGDAIPPRFQAQAVIVANPAQYTRVRQFDTSGGAGLWVRVGEGLGKSAPNTGHELIGYGAWKSSQMLAPLTTGNRIMLGGDFSLFKIVDRVGMDLELIPHLFGATNRFPTGQRGIFGFWRNGSKLIDQNAFRFLKTL